MNDIVHEETRSSECLSMDLDGLGTYGIDSKRCKNIIVSIKVTCFELVSIVFYESNEKKKETCSPKRFFHPRNDGWDLVFLKMKGTLDADTCFIHP